MRLVLVLLLGLLAPHALLAQGTGSLRGVVLEAETGRPLAGAHVFLAGTMRGTTTDEAGRYRLDGLEVGAHRLVASMVGFETAARTLVLRRGEARRDTLRLAEAVVEVGSVTVTAEADRRWRRRLRRFERLFVGETDGARQTRIVNPEVLDFDGGWGRLVARAAEPLVLENRALGYRVHYLLEHFEAAGASVRDDGEPLYEELQPSGPEEAARWAANRRRAYQGSFRHLMHALLAGRTREEGFVLYSRPSTTDLGPGPARFHLSADRLLQPAPAPDQQLLAFRGFVEVHYLNEPVADGFRRWRGAGGHAAPTQWSWLELTAGPTAVDPDGTVIDPYGVTVYGYFAYERVADELPKEYRPF